MALSGVAESCGHSVPDRRVGEMHKILMLPDLASDGGGVSYERPLEDRTGSR